jgi:hypothetical protein
MLLQISSPAAFSAETWAAIAAAVGAIAVVAKKLIQRHRSPKPEYITRAELRQEMTATRDRIAASYLVIADKLDANHKELLTALDRQVTRINRLETDVARVDERTKYIP